ncbi:hypothetical protein [Polaromonas naphthalenivorans]|uniref:Uncharacterized protein n=1 Tax=Polaromonas naphthalenivorans (strain CJ2) TaxID=365044 RepID=A1VW69_POLNA|nr:hypothetical protein [Polaromonas naphthalenivorans]ABM39897.1 conserved hypothetical protein [Polaromonas naphthalenivorans CJ2]
MPAISKSALADAITAVGKMDNRQRELLADDIHAHQPQLLASVLAQQQFGASLEQIEVLLKVLLVSYRAMENSGHVWPVVSEEMQERCFARFAGKIRFLEGLTHEQKATVISDAVTDHNEKWLLAFVFDELQAHDLLVINTDAKKFLVLCALGMVECVAEAASHSV